MATRSGSCDRASGFRKIEQEWETLKVVSISLMERYKKNVTKAQNMADKNYVPAFNYFRKAKPQITT